MAFITLQHFKEWLDNYGNDWKTGDPKSAVKLFTRDVQYYETPFDDPIIGKDGIHQYWSEGAEKAQRDVQFSYQIISLNKNIGYARWQATFIRIPSGKKVELDGVLSAEFNKEGKCRVFREWWHRRES